jgi:hypothetical protein
LLTAENLLTQNHAGKTCLHFAVLASEIYSICGSFPSLSNKNLVEIQSYFESNNLPECKEVLELLKTLKNRHLE